MRGFTAVEVAVLFVMMAVLVALVLVLAPTPPAPVVNHSPELKIDAPVVNVSPELKIDGEKLGRELVKAAMEEAKKGALGVASVGSFEATKTECMNNVRNLAALLITMREFPTKHGGVNLLLWLVNKGDLPGEDNLKILFCPGDTHESLEDAGGVEAYVGIDLTKKGEYDHLSSYAGRDQLNKACRTMGGRSRQVALVCDDSEDHHGGKGFVIAFTGGSVKFRHKFDDWEIDVKTPVAIGEGSAIKELVCMKAD